MLVALPTNCITECLCTSSVTCATISSGVAVSICCSARWVTGTYHPTSDVSITPSIIKYLYILSNTKYPTLSDYLLLWEWRGYGTHKDNGKHDDDSKKLTEYGRVLEIVAAVPFDHRFGMVAQQWSIRKTVSLWRGGRNQSKGIPQCEFN